ncbi:MAG: hypothetical protein JSS10_07805 [Verrucomicrobia bacterium]|nr:hypothetical protein [Verrucomicrobiota bacterium]
MKFKPWVYLLASCALGYGGYSLYQRSANPPHQLSLSAIQYDRPYEPLYDTRPLTGEEQQEAEKALRQDYTYFGCGGQAYVFFSVDGKYALKFFDQRHFREPTHLNYIPFIKKYRDLKYAKRKKKVQGEYGSYKMGFEQLPEETALVYVHLNKTSHLKKSITYIDKQKKEHKIDLDKTDFIIQRRAELVHDKIHRQMAAGDVEGAKQTISSVVNLIVARCKKGYSDKDPNIATNCGILNGRAIKIDVGRFAIDPRMKNPLFFKPELFHLVRPFHHWLSQKYPDLAEHLNHEVFQVIAHE